MNELELRMQDVEREESLSDSALDNVEREGEPGLPDLQLVERRPEQLRHEAQVRPVRALRGEHRLRHDAVLEPGMRRAVLVCIGSVVHLAEAAPAMSTAIKEGKRIAKSMCVNECSNEGAVR